MDKAAGVYTGIGSRETPPHVLGLIVEIAEALRDLDWTVRSGRAPGADQAFERGGAPKAEIFLPWKAFEHNEAKVDAKLNQPLPEAFEIAKQFHPAWERLRWGGRALHARNAHQILGADLHSPTRCVVCWTPDGSRSGGTGQALRMATHFGIPIVDLGLPEYRDVTLVTAILEDVYEMVS